MKGGARLEADVANYIMRDGIPPGCVLEAVEDDPVAELLKEGERIGDAVERYRHRLRELAADRPRINSGPWPFLPSARMIGASKRADHGITPRHPAAERSLCRTCRSGTIFARPQNLGRQRSRRGCHRRARIGCLSRRCRHGAGRCRRSKPARCRATCARRLPARQTGGQRRISRWLAVRWGDVNQGVFEPMTIKDIPAATAHNHGRTLRRQFVPTFPHGVFPRGSFGHNRSLIQNLPKGA